MKQCKVIIGKNFGDEGKGLMTAYFTSEMTNANCRCLIIKHNGGAQAGHTVDLGTKKIVFHQIGSGSIFGGNTFWADTFIVDLFKLTDEIKDFEALSTLDKPLIYASKECRVTTVYDVLLNNILEQHRGNQKHGSCGMGIYETVLRNENSRFSLKIKDIYTYSLSELINRLRDIRDNYVLNRLMEQGVDLKAANIKECVDLILDENVVFNSAEIMLQSLKDNIRVVSNDITSIMKLLKQFDGYVFENAQGLLLDRDNVAYFPHLTPSKTGCYNVNAFIQKYFKEELLDIEVCYVTRTYITRHGAGWLPYECAKSEINVAMCDTTNVFNLWQENLRYAKHGDIDEFMAEVQEDIGLMQGKVKASLVITHLNETNNKICTCQGELSIREYLASQVFSQIYLSNTKDISGIKLM